MSGDTIITVIGNLTGDPELRFTASGAPVANFTIASTPRTYSKANDQWEDGEALFLRCSIWRQPAENVAESLTRGTRVIAQGKLVQRSYETKEGEKRTVVELQVEEIGASVKFATVRVNRADRTDAKAAAGTGRKGRGSAAEDPWGSAPAAGSTGYEDEPPF